ncbi:MAG TPA: hypothetical protein VFX16_27030 [Pseudonocardiaceae bacterium]|nr:hypothetical protein [Pseudonocardiaceae bacterium]
MLPTLLGRIQTRLFLMALIGGPVTALITLALPLTGPYGPRYQATFIVLGSVAIIGIVWEIIYHVAMQWRWEKDWPTLFGLLTLVPEGILVGILARMNWLPLLPGAVPVSAFAIQFIVVWVCVWLFANGPMRTPFIRWRFNGGRLV